MTYTKRLLNMIEEAKTKKDITKLFEIKEFIEESLQEIEQYKRNRRGRGKEVYQLNEEIRELQDLNLKIFSVNGVIERNAHFRTRNLINKKEKDVM